MTSLLPSPQTQVRPPSPLCPQSRVCRSVGRTESVERRFDDPIPYNQINKFPCFSPAAFPPCVREQTQTLTDSRTERTNFFLFIFRSVFLMPFACVACASFLSLFSSSSLLVTPLHHPIRPSIHPSFFPQTLALIRPSPGLIRLCSDLITPSQPTQPHRRFLPGLASF